MSKIYLSSPHMGSAELKHIHEAFDTNWISTVGPQINAFEKVLADYSGVSHAAALASGTAAIHLALKLLGVGPGDYVLCQSFTFAGTAFPIIHAGATPVFIDSEPETWNMCPIALEEAIVGLKSNISNLKSIIPVHLYGTPANMPAICAVADKYGIPIVEDAAEALGASIDGQMCGSFGDMGILSFNGNKIITTSGGGALLSNNRDYIEKAKFLATQARDPAPHYEHTQIGYNYRMGNINAAIGLGQMEVLEERVKRRREIFDIYFSEFKNHFEFPSSSFVTRTKEFATRTKEFATRTKEFTTNTKEATKTKEETKSKEEANTKEFTTKTYSNRWLTTILTPSFQAREKIRLSLEVEDIESRPLWKPMHMQPVFKDAPYFGGTVSEDLFTRGLCLPSGSNMTDDDVARVIRVVKQSI